MKEFKIPIILGLILTIVFGVVVYYIDTQNGELLIKEGDGDVIDNIGTGSFGDSFPTFFINTSDQI